MPQRKGRGRTLSNTGIDSSNGPLAELDADPRRAVEVCPRKNDFNMAWRAVGTTEISDRVPGATQPEESRPGALTKTAAKVQAAGTGSQLGVQALLRPPDVPCPWWSADWGTGP